MTETTRLGYFFAVTGATALLFLSIQAGFSVVKTPQSHLQPFWSFVWTGTDLSCRPCDFATFTFENVSDVTSLNVGNCSFHQYSVEDQINRIHNATIRKKQVWIAFYGDSMLRNPLYYWALGRLNGPIKHPQYPTAFMCCSNILDINTCTTSYHGDEAGDPPSIAATKFLEENNTFRASWKLIKNPATVSRELKRLLEPENTPILPDLIAHDPGLWYFLEQDYTPMRYRKEMLEASYYMNELVHKGVVVVVNGITAIEELKTYHSNTHKHISNRQIIELAAIVNDVLVSYPLIKRIHWLSATLTGKYQPTHDGIHWGHYVPDQLYVSMQAHLNFLFRSWEANAISTTFCLKEHENVH